MTIKIPIPNDWNGEDCKCWAVMWPDSPQWKAVLNGLIMSPSRGRFWDETTGNIKDTQASFLPFYDDNFILSEVIMSCNNGVSEALIEMAASFNNIATAIAQQGTNTTIGTGSCGNQNCYNSQTMNLQSLIDLGELGIAQVYGSQPGAILPESGFPEGYDTQEEYNADKCAKATKLVNDLAAVLRNMGNIEWGVSAVTAVAIVGCMVGVITVPEVTIPVLVWILLSGVSLTTAFLALATWFEENREYCVCLLYETDGVDSVISVFSFILTVALTALALEGAVALAIRQIVILLLSTDTLNFLFTERAKQIYPAADCSGCSGCVPELSFEFGSGDLTLDGSTRTLTAELYPGNGLYYLRIVNASADPCCEVYFEQVSNTGDLPRWEMNEFKCDSAIVWEQDWFFGTAPTGSNVYGNFEYPGYISMGCANPFTVDVILDVAH